MFSVKKVRVIDSGSRVNPLIWHPVTYTRSRMDADREMFRIGNNNSKVDESDFMLEKDSSGGFYVLIKKKDRGV